jgi:hypothetical protein
VARNESIGGIQIVIHIPAAAKEAEPWAKSKAKVAYRTEGNKYLFVKHGTRCSHRLRLIVMVGVPEIPVPFMI